MIVTRLFLSLTRSQVQSFRGAHEVREPGIQMQSTRPFLDSGFAGERPRPGMTEICQPFYDQLGK
jgi:hypothetical protein